MAEDNKRLLILGSKSGGGGGGNAVWGQITGTLSNQTDLQNALDAKADSSSVPTKTSDLTNDSGFRRVIEINDMTQAELLDFYTNYETLMAQNTYVVDGHEAVATTMQQTAYGTVLILESNVRYKNEFAGAAPGTIDALGTATYIFADGSKNRDNLTFNLPETSGLATVATSGDYDDLTNKPTIPAVSGTNDGTNWTSLTVGSDTYGIPSGGGNDWYGTQEQFDLIPAGQLDQNTTYYISGKLDYENDFTNKPFVPTDTNQLTNGADFQNKKQVSTQVSTEVMSGLGYLDKTNVYLTQTEFDTMRTAGTLKPGYTYHIQGDMETVQMVVTFTDQSTATYDVFFKA